ncbi:hypothetical protein AB434_2492 [Heyndrickxia coagulans]|uniref:Uncharacterized protein n=1 Tax=Heyndrickxia coagulans TaxID=1398 RepID=A0A0C5CA97_HEYCO|nr:hypothetical protein SB48_HM08orf04483 [Heyndrickxia coagulans]AKN54897.1 hypothetical protein AB434_2492 [Heyndrickxia coagulans]KYC65251.1 hypothetical protein B4098_0204 [Heyndrickxia coagulans]
MADYSAGFPHDGIVAKVLCKPERRKSPAPILLILPLLK